MNNTSTVVMSRPPFTPRYLPAAQALRMVALLPLLFGIGTASVASAEDTAKPARPNVIVIYCDDLGYGDLACYGNEKIKTPHLDRMAKEGQRFTQFYSAASVCTPSRAALMTGRYPIRSGMCHNRRRVLFPNSKGGLPASEVTIAELVRAQGYATACVGKWHLGHRPEFLPTRHGFDHYFGIPYSNDMDRVAGAPRNALYKPKSEYFNVPLLRDEKEIERPADQATLTKRYTEEAIKFIDASGDKPFFLYLAHSMPHVPLFRSTDFEGRSEGGIYGDVIEEIDWSVGQILDHLRENKLDESTLVVFSSDNGPWLPFGDHGGTAGPLRGGKGATFEGGMREPGIFWWPGSVEPGVIDGLGSTLDLLPTVAALSGAALPDDRTLDGYDLSGTLLDREASPRDHMIYYRGKEIWAVRKGPYKAHFRTHEPERGQRKVLDHQPPLLYDLEHDRSEKHNIAEGHDDVIAELKQFVEEHKKTVEPCEDQLAR